MIREFLMGISPGAPPIPLAEIESLGAAGGLGAALLARCCGVANLPHFASDVLTGLLVPAEARGAGVLRASNNAGGARAADFRGDAGAFLPAEGALQVNQRFVARVTRAVPAVEGETSWKAEGGKDDHLTVREAHLAAAEGRLGPPGGAGRYPGKPPPRGRGSMERGIRPGRTLPPCRSARAALVRLGLRGVARLGRAAHARP
jgi:hypothetical protein